MKRFRAFVRHASHLPGARKLLRRTLLAGVADMNLFHEVTAHMRRMDKVFIAAINGLALGGGCELALACDLRLMAEDDQVERFLGQPEVLIGLIPGGGGTQMLARSLGVARALELCLEGQLLEPRQALALGLVNGLAPARRNYWKPPTRWRSACPGARRRRCT
ncbi:enoyl-CoA hydratase/isomerase family protein [Pseudomonas aeruginosa]|nr:enoyl-CoA hydratase/isomerase family protein [Pseudomonas aeruginosa]